MTDEGVVVLEEVCPLQHPVQLQLGLIAGQTRHNIWNNIKLN